MSNSMIKAISNLTFVSKRMAGMSRNRVWFLGYLVLVDTYNNNPVNPSLSSLLESDDSIYREVN